MVITICLGQPPFATLQQIQNAVAVNVSKSDIHFEIHTADAFVLKAVRRTTVVLLH